MVISLFDFYPNEGDIWEEVGGYPGNTWIEDGNSWPAGEDSTGGNHEDERNDEAATFDWMMIGNNGCIWQAFDYDLYPEILW
jgi:hypothetical protein